MRSKWSTLFLPVALVAAGLFLAACDGQAPAPVPAEPAVEASASESSDAAPVRLSSELQVFELLGPAESITPAAWTVAGISFVTDEGTELLGQIAPGERVKVELALRADGQLFARQIEPASSVGSFDGLGELEFVGALQATGENEWSVNGMALQVGPGTELKGSMQVGDRVKVHARIGEGGVLTAREIEPAASAEDPSPSSGEFEFVASVESIGESSWTVGGRTLTFAPGAEIKGPIAVGSSVKVHAVQQPDGTWLVREIEIAGPDDLDDDSQDDTSFEAGEDFKFFGVVEAIGNGAWSIGGLTFTVTDATEFDSHIVVGDVVRVELIRNADGSLTAKEIEEDDDRSSSDDDDDQGDDNSGSGSTDDDDDDNSGSGSSGSDDDDDDNSGSGGGGSGSDDD